MILRKLLKESLIYSQHNNNVKKSLTMNLLIQNKPQDNLSFLQRVTYNFSRNKQQLKKKNIPANQSNKPNEGIDLSTLPKQQQFMTLKQGIHELIENRQDDAYFMDILQTFSNFITSHNRIKDGIIEFGQIIKKMKAVPAFRLSPNYHYALCEYRYFLVRGGRFDQAITVCQECSRLLKKGSQKQSLHVANELGTFGVVQFMNNNYQESRRLLQKQDKINQKLCDETFTEYIDCKNNLAILDFVQANYESALKTFEKNQQLTKRILKSTKKGKEKLYAKHLVYLQAIYEMKIAQSQSEQNKNLLKQKANQFNREILDIMSDHNNLVNDLYLYYETISLHFLKNNLNELCVKFIQKAINLNQKKIEKPSLGGKRDRSIFQVTNTISKHYKILGDAYINLKQFQKANDSYLRAFNRYKKNIFSQQAKQMLTLQNFTTFIQTCHSLFELQFIQQNKNKKSFEEAMKYIEEPLLVWNDAVKNIWNTPQWLSFVPYQLNIQIGIKLLENNYIDPAVTYFQICSKQIQNSKSLLCQKSKKDIGQLTQKITALIEKQEIKNSESYQSLKAVSNELSSFSKI